jgi:hypothetical protein
MRSARWMIAAAVLLGLTAAAPGGQERGMGGVGITVYADPNYRGENASFDRDVRDLGEYRLADRISSLRVAPGEYWEVCEAPNFRGQCQVFYDTEPDLRRVRWDNRISSMRRVRGGGGWGGGGNVPRDGIVLFSDTRFRGAAREFRSAESNLVPLGFNDDARSLRLGGRPWEVCHDAGYRNCEIVSDDIADLNQIGMSRRISSLRPAADWGRGGRGGPGGGQVGRLELFEKRRFGGDSTALEWPAETLGRMSARAESLRLSGTWEICDREYFRGRCITISRNVENLDDMGWKDRIRSARPR